MKLEGKVAFVTGAAHNQGRSHARFLAREGAKVVALDICEDIPGMYPLGTKAELDETVTMIKDEGGEAFAVVADVRSSAQVKAAVDQTVETYGTVDILVNNAGVCYIHPIDEISDEDLETIFDVNLKGVFNTTRFVAQGMKQKKYGKIINTASCGAIRPQPYGSAYMAAKGGVVAATKSWAAELAEWHINVNAISPGTVHTGMTTGLAAQIGKPIDEAYAEMTSPHAFKGEWGHIQSEDISAMVLFLATEDSRMITGMNVAVDAGFCIT